MNFMRRGRGSYDTGILPETEYGKVQSLNPYSKLAIHSRQSNLLWVNKLTNPDFGSLPEQGL